MLSGDRGDDRCRRRCDAQTPCPLGEICDADRTALNCSDIVLHGLCFASDGGQNAGGVDSGGPDAGNLSTDAGDPWAFDDAGVKCAALFPEYGWKCEYNRCGAGQRCFTSISCNGPDSGTGTSPCYPSPASERGDDRCHYRCDVNTPCPAGEVCEARNWQNCTDVVETGICCPADGGC